MWLRRWFRSDGDQKPGEGQHPERKRKIAEAPPAWGGAGERQAPSGRHVHRPVDALRGARRDSSLRRDSRRAGRASEDAPAGDEPLIFEVDTELSTRLRLTARTQDLSAEELAAELLARGLEREARRAQAEAALASLTPREQEIAWLTARGRTNRQIARTLFISIETVKTHVRHMLDKFGVRSKADLRLLFIDLGMRWWEG